MKDSIINMVVRIGDTWCKTHNEWLDDPMRKMEWYLETASVIAVSTDKYVDQLKPDMNTNCLCRLPVRLNNKMRRAMLKAYHKFHNIEA